MTKAKMDYLWATKSEGVVEDMLTSIGITKVGKSGRFPTGVKYDTLIAISEAMRIDEQFSSMVASRTHDLQKSRGPKSRGPSVDSVVSALQSGKMSESDLKAAMKKAGLI